MSKYINADEFTTTIRKSTSPSGAEWIVAKVNEMPSADVVAVVRCKDCKHFKGKRDMCLQEDIRYRYVCGDFATFEPDEDFWCKYGERKETDD